MRGAMKANDKWQIPENPDF